MSLAQLTEHWNEQLPFPLTNDGFPFPLARLDTLPRSNEHGDFATQNWKKLFSDEHVSKPMSALSFQKSENKFLNDHGRDRFSIERRWDVDSWMARVDSLAVHKGGFSLSFVPPFLRRITQNPRVKFNGKWIQKLKQLRLGSGLLAGGFGYDCHVFFPRLPVSPGGETHLTHLEQASWYDNIVIPSLQATCPNDILQHFPRSWNEADTKARVKQEFHEQDSRASIDSRYILSENLLEPFWANVIARSNNELDLRYTEMYREPFLVISGHNLKYFTKTSTSESTRTAFMKHILDCFRIEYIQTEDCWLDLGMEDTPTSPSITLLRKSSCLNHWLNLFDCPEHASSLVQPRRYFWQGTRDAISGNVELGMSNAWRYLGGIAYNKSYNLHKDVFATPMKNYSPFDNSQFEALGFDQDLLEKWYKVNRLGNSHHYQQKRQRLRRQYIATKIRIFEGLKATRSCSFGVRQEYRINFGLFLIMNLNEDVIYDTWDKSATEPSRSASPSIGKLPCQLYNNCVLTIEIAHSARFSSGFATNASDIDHSHRPYWILPTPEITAFAMAQTNRWLFLLEVLMSQVKQGSEGLMSIDHQNQIINGMTISVIMRTLRFSSESIEPKTHPELWLNGYPQRRRGHRAPVHPRRNMVGLNYSYSVTRYGAIWLPSQLFLWQSAPLFKSTLFKRLAFARNGLQDSFHKVSNITQIITHRDQFFQLFRQHAQRYRYLPDCSERRREQNRVGKLAGQLIVQQYIQEVFELLRSRAKGSDETEAPIVQEPLEEPWVTVQQGLCGLDHALIERLLLLTPHVVLARRETAPGKGRFGPSYFANYNMTLWSGKLAGLFGWDDEPPASSRAGASTKIKYRGWHNKQFRILAQRLCAIMIEENNAMTKSKFMEMIMHVAAKKLWIIPQYDADKLSVMQKPSKHNSQVTYDAIEARNLLERTNWIMPQLKAEHFDMLHCSEIRRRNDQSTQNKQSTEYKSICNLLKDELPVLMEDQYANQHRGLIKDAQYYGQNIFLGMASDFQEELKQFENTATAETSSDDSSNLS